MKMLRLVIALGILLLVFVGCAGDNPASAAEEWFKAANSADGATALKLTCEQYQADMQMSGFLTAGLGLFAGIDTQSAESDLSDVTFETISKTNDTAMVHVEGEVIISLLGAAMPQQINMDLKMVKEDSEWKWCGQ